jgi:cell division protein FtsB
MRRRRKRAPKRFKVILILAILAVPMFYLGKRVYRFGDALLEERELKKNMIILEAENEVLKQRIYEYKKGNLIETKAREDLGMIKKGEKIYIIREK